MVDIKRPLQSQEECAPAKGKSGKNIQETYADEKSKSKRKLVENGSRKK